MLSAVLLGAVPASHAGVHFGIGIGLPLPGLVIGRPPVCATVPPVVYPPYNSGWCAPGPVYQAPLYSAPPVWGPRPYYWHGPGWWGPRHFEHHGYWGHRW